MQADRVCLAGISFRDEALCAAFYALHQHERKQHGQNSADSDGKTAPFILRRPAGIFSYPLKPSPQIPTALPPFFLPDYSFDSDK